MGDELIKILRMLLNLPHLIAGELPKPEKPKADAAPKSSAEAEEQV